MVEDILDRNQIHYNHLVVKNVGTKNTIITDGKNVLVKMRGIDKSLEEFSSDVLFTAHNKDQGFALLIPQIVHPFKRGLNGVFSVWKYEDCVVLNASGLTQRQGIQAVEELHKIHQSTPYLGLQRKTDDITERIAKNFSSVQFKTLSAATQHRVKRFYVEVAQPAILLMSPPVYGAVVAHGKAIPNRINIRPDGILRWSDFETVRLTRKEYDLASLKLFLKITGVNLSTWESVEAKYKEFYPDIDDGLVDLFVGQLISERIFHYSSQVNTVEREQELNRFMEDSELLFERKLPNFLRMPGVLGENL